jgi:dTDP-4-amino-4,6-dideoxygalactose transaminase
MKVDFYRHQLGRADVEAVSAVLATPFLTTGNVASAVETQLSTYFSMPHAVLVNNWTNGAIAVLLAMDVGPGHEVIVPAMTFIASANVVELVGAKVVFADVDPATLLLTPELAVRHVTQRTRAIIPVHLYGQMCDIPGLRAMIQRHPAASQHIAIMEDCAHCFEGEREGMKPGSASDVAIFSFYATKNVTCGEGGAIVTGDSGLYERILAT